MPTCPPSPSSSHQLPCDTPSFSSFLFFFRWQKVSDNSGCFHTGRWLDRDFLQPRLKTKSNPKSSLFLFSVLIYSFFFLQIFTHNRCLVLLPVSVNHGNQASPFSHLVSPFSKPFTFTSQNIFLNPNLCENKGETVCFCLHAAFEVPASLAHFTSLARARFRRR